MESGIVRERVRQNLDCDVSVQFCIAGAVHLTHAAFADGGEDQAAKLASPVADQSERDARVHHVHSNPANCSVHSRLLR
jgi:hypothetical protein